MMSWRICLLITTLVMVVISSASSLRTDFYNMSCPSAESIVKTTVDEALSKNPGLGSGLIRLHFHDCFVRGCDGSVLIDSTARNKAEKESPANKPSLRGFEVIDLAKARIEKACPRTVSCADILTFAARDSVTRLGGFHYTVPAGRRDGVVSSMLEVLQNLPGPSSDVQNLKSQFGVKGLSMDEMVTLSGAHSIGVSHCTSFTHRLYPRQDTSIDPVFAAQLKASCPQNGSNTTTVQLDVVSPNRLDNSYYKNLQIRRGLFFSDQILWNDPATKNTVGAFANDSKIWAAKFAAAMIHMGGIEVKIGEEGEIRNNCRVIN